MRFMMIVKASPGSEAGQMPPQELIAAMGRYNEELMKAGVLVDLSGLQPTSKGARVQFSGSARSVVDGPFAYASDLIAGYWILNVKSKQEAVDWALRAPNPMGESGEGEIEIRQFFELEDFGESEAIDRARELENKLGKQ